MRSQGHCNLKGKKLDQVTFGRVDWVIDDFMKSPMKIHQDVEDKKKKEHNS